MPLQNRVTPFGVIEALPGRGLVLGNRGVLHDDARRLVRQRQVRRWIACRLEWKNIRRVVMTPRRYTELFFLDEATAYSAGHRPCAECRNADYKRFRRLWEERFDGTFDAGAIDRALQAERLEAGRKRTFRAELRTLPDGTFIVHDDAPHLVWGAELLRWSDSGYLSPVPRPRDLACDVLTPASIVDVFRAGLRPGVHPSATGRSG